jgi:hypothetical protein
MKEDKLRKSKSAKGLSSKSVRKHDRASAVETNESIANEDYGSMQQ